MFFKFQRPTSNNLKKILYSVTLLSAIIFMVTIPFAAEIGEEANIMDLIAGIFLSLAVGGALATVILFIYKTFGKTSSILKFHKRSLFVIILLNLLFFVPFYFRQQSLNNRLMMVEEKLGGADNIACTDEDLEKVLRDRVVRVIGSWAEGSGFPYSEQEILTNYHVIEGEDAPKVIFPDGSIENPIIVKGDPDRDLALLVLDKKMEPLKVAAFSSGGEIVFGEDLFASGYPLGSRIQGDTTIIKGNYSGTRRFRGLDIGYIESDIELVKGMSGGPLVDSCGRLVGVNTSGIGGVSYFIDASDIEDIRSEINNEKIEKFVPDTSNPLGVVEAYYYYLRTKQLEKAYTLLGADKIRDMDFEDFERGYKNTLHVNLISIERDRDDNSQINIKLMSQDWEQQDLVVKYFEGYWVVNDLLKMNESNIKQVKDPDWDWFYDFLD